MAKHSQVTFKHPAAMSGCHSLSQSQFQNVSVTDTYMEMEKCPESQFPCIGCTNLIVFNVQMEGLYC